MAKKQRNMTNIETSYQLETMKVVKVILLVLLIFGAFYLITGIATGQIKLGSKNKPKEDTIIQYEEITAGQSFDQSEDEYLVLYHDFTKEEAGLYQTWLSNYKAKDKALKTYTVNMASVFSKGYQSEEENRTPNSIDDLKIKDVTLIRFKDRKVVEYISGKDAVIAYFSNFGK